MPAIASVTPCDCKLQANTLQGTGKDFCAVPDNCQRDFGFCDSDVVPSGYNMSSDARRPEGAIEYGKVITTCKVPKAIALSYDDTPSNDTEELLNILKNANAKATFFVAGNSQGKGPVDTTAKWTKIIKRMVEEGHQVGSHTWSHPDMDKIGSEERKLEMLKMERAFSNILGKYPTYMRPPYLACSESQGCLSDMKDLGYHVIAYNYDSEDYKNPDDLDKMKDRIDLVFNQTGRDGNMLLIQHDTIQKSAIELTKHVLQRVQERGWRAITVGECLQDDPKGWYRDPVWTTPAESAKDGCVVAGGHFCGKVNEFHDMEECFKSNQQCQKDAEGCAKNASTDKEACRKMQKICDMQFLYCTQCGGSKNTCETKYFIVNKED
jgi:peptidoglycan/xylan/chitin deacetylase (PgdA/CDA1 family)